VSKNARENAEKQEKTKRPLEKESANLFTLTTIILYVNVIIYNIYIMRDIWKVVGDIYSIVIKNDNEKKSIKETFIYRLDKIRDSMLYAAPELLKSPHFFLKLQDVINSSISVDDYDTIPWCKEVIDIFMDPDYGIEKDKND
jgi:hypothetical protein